MKNIYFDSINGLAIPDGRCEIEAKEFLTDPNRNEIVVSTSLFIYAVRIMVLRDIIPHDEVIFHFNGQEVFIDDCGKLHDWPSGFADKFDVFLEELLLNGSIKFQRNRS